jgi:mannose-6-phosphate isomerase-like protein (cupin superfamily)
MANVQTRRNFLRTAPIAAAALPAFLPLTDALLHAQAPATEAGEGATFKLFPAAMLEGMVKSLEEAPAAKDIVTGKVGVSITISAEEKKAAKEFEYHQHRDHVFQVLDGSTQYELGGTPKNARQTKPGEWLAPQSEGHTTITLNKGDMLVVPRMTPHKRTTEGTVSLLLINATSPA